MKSATLIKTGNPFPGLRPFQEDEEFLFFGRESQVHTMVDKLVATHFLAVVGASGSGKSSLVNCGLRPALHRGLMAKAGTAWRMAQFRPGGNPICALAGALAQDGVLFRDFDSSVIGLEDIIEASLRMSRLGLSRLFNDAHLPAGTNLLIVVDQFEELFRYRNPSLSGETDAKQRTQDDAAFVNLLLDPRTHPDLPVYIVLTMRSDFLGDCAEFAGLPEAINESEYLIPRLTREERRAAISGPIGVGEAVISPVLLTRLVNDVGDNPDQLSILQHALNRTWAEWDKAGNPEAMIELRHYEAIGTMAHALDLHAERAYNELPTDRAKKICEKVFKALTDKQTDPRGIRRPTKFGVLRKVAEATPEELCEVLSVFRKPSRSFLMPPIADKLDDNKVIDISHESLMRIWRRLIGWTEDEVQSARQYRRLSESAALFATQQASLWDDPQLQFALEWKAREAPNEDWAELYGGEFNQAMDFLRESERHRDEERQEKEKQREHELQQAKDLANERQRRLEEQMRAAMNQARAAQKMRRWFLAVCAASVCLLVLCGWACWEYVQATRAQAESELAKTESELARKDRYHEALRSRQSTLRLLNMQEYLASQLAQFAHPQGAARWYLLTANARLEEGNYKAANEPLTRAFALNPNDASIRTERGYLALLLNRPKDGLADFEYIRDKIDRTSPVNYLNLTIAYAALGDYGSARKALKDAIDGMGYRTSEGGNESLISPDITRATGRLTLAAEGPVFKAALYYEQANIEAYTGDTMAFHQALDRADQEAKLLAGNEAQLHPSALQQEALFVAMTWAWLHLRVQCPEDGSRCQDYGAVAAQAALWERAGYKNWANCYYGRFIDKHKRWADARFTQLVNAVPRPNRRTETLCNALQSPEEDVLAFETEARESLARGDLEEAKENAAKAISTGGPAERTRLLGLEADILIGYARAEREKAASSNADADDASKRLNELRARQAADVSSAQQHKAGPFSGSIPGENARQIENKYRDEMATASQEKERSEKEAKVHELQAASALEKLKLDCSEMIKISGTATAYYYLALAEWWTKQSETDAVRSALQNSLHLDPDNMDTLELLYELAPHEDAARNEYFRKYRPQLDRYFRSAPASAETLEGQARLALQDRRRMDALRLVETAIEMKPDRLDLYDLRAKIQRSLGFDDAQVRSALASGYHQAGFVLKVHGKDWRASTAFEKEWQAVSEVAARRDPAEIRCNESMSVCTVTRFANVVSEEIYSRIQEIRNDKGDPTALQVTIDRGRDDGVIVGTQGEVWAQYLKSGRRHERPVVKIGTGEVVSVKPDSALVSVQVDQSQGDGLVRKADMMNLRIPVPAGHPKSLMWTLAKTDVSYADSDGMPLVDFQKLYSADTPPNEEEFVQYVLDDIRKSANNVKDLPDLIPKGRFEGKTYYEVMSTADKTEIRNFLDFVTSIPTLGLYLTDESSVSSLYAKWLAAGAKLP